KNLFHILMCYLLFDIQFPEPVHIYNNQEREKVTVRANFFRPQKDITHKDNTLRQTPKHFSPNTEHVCTKQALPQSPIPSAWPEEGLYRFAATMDAEGTYLMVYVPVGRTFTLNT
ncbi:MAG: hypothetical protein ACI4UA_07015, partial [Bacteroidaceae bacterium]